MKAIEIEKNIYRLAANISSADLFEGIWPIPHGVSLNSYLVVGEKIALIDLVKEWEHAPTQLEDQLKSLNLSYEDLDYLILNHLEPDHTGWLKCLKSKNPSLTIITSRKGVQLVKAFYHIEENVKPVDDGDKLQLGNDMELTFYEAPNVHWPETMVTHAANSGVLFSCDAFGSFGRIEEAIFDDQLSQYEQDFFERETLRYYSNIVSTFSPFVIKAIEKLAPLNIRIIAPSHGIIWRKNPQQIINQYKRLAGYYNGDCKKQVAVIWSSMYSNTEQMLQPIVQGLEAEKINYKLHRVPQTHASFVLASAWESKGLILGMPTYEYRMFPPMANILDIFDRSHVKNRLIFRFGSYGWSGGAQKQLEEITRKLKWDFLRPVEFQGAPTKGDIEEGYRQARQLARIINGDLDIKDATL